MSISEAEVQARVGEPITIEVEMGSACPHAPKIAKYTGIVLRSERWDPPNTFRMEGNHILPVRVVPYNCVMRVNDGAIKQTSNEVDNRWSKHIVPNSKGTGEYVVTHDKVTDKWTCQCKGFEIRKTCSHISGVAAKENET